MAHHAGANALFTQPKATTTWRHLLLDSVVYVS